eukprot:GEMP01063831.1.p1 GENE.GEMP01063831.1~~GEMP01063831.1.p1  ORF type:complete len:255 (+),score=53.86 GEMP01063831.1:115-879(+)
MKKLQLKYRDEDKCMLAQKLGLGPGWKVDFYESGKRYWVTPQEKRITEWKEVARWHEEQNLPVPPFFRKENGAQNMEFFLTHDATLPIKRQMNLLEYMSMRRATTDENAQENAQGETAKTAGTTEDTVLNEHPWSMRREKDDNLANEELEPRREISADVVEDGNVANEELEPRREISADVVELLRLPTSIYCTETEPIKSMNLKLSLKSFLEAVHEGLSEEECYAKICVPIDEFDEYLFSAPDITSRAELPTTT